VKSTECGACFTYQHSGQSHVAGQNEQWRDEGKTFSETVEEGNHAVGESEMFSGFRQFSIPVLPLYFVLSKF
jgi:hypothetical protein